MPNLKNILKRCEIQVARKRRTCTNSKKVIHAGEKCIVIWDSQYDRHPYCKEIALKIIKQARFELDELENSLNN